MFSSFAERFCRFLIQKKIISSEEEELYVFGLGVLFSKSAITLLCLLIGGLTHNLLATLLFLVYFMPLRAYAGGYHAGSEAACFVESLVLFGFLLGSVNLFSFPRAVCLGITAVSGLVIWILAPVEDKNKPLEKEEQALYRKKARWILSAELFAAVLIAYAQRQWRLDEKYLMVACGCLFLQALLAALGKIKNAVLEEKTKVLF